MLSKKASSFGGIVSVIGVTLVVLGIAWLIANNWHSMPSFLKIAILVIATGSTYTLGVILTTRESTKSGHALILLGSLLYTLSIFLIAQIFSTSTTLQGTAFLLLLAWTGVFISAYLFDSPLSLIVGLIEFLIWISIQYFALKSADQSMGALALVYLITGIFIYGLALLHGSFKHVFTKVYALWTAFYFLLFAYILSFQSFLPRLWNDGIAFSFSTGIFLGLAILLAFTSFVIGLVVALNKKTIRVREILSVLGIAVLFTVLVLAASAVSNTVGTCYQKSCYEFKTQKDCSSAVLNHQTCAWQQGFCQTLSCYQYYDENSCNGAPNGLSCIWNSTFGGCSEKSPFLDSRPFGEDACSINDNNRAACVASNSCVWNAGSYAYYNQKNMPASLWALWIFSNVVFILVILSVIGYGTWKHNTAIVNLGVMFFVIDVVTRYIGFVMDLWGYTSLSIIFISGGLLLLVGGWLIEKWRRRLIEKARSTSTRN